MKPNNITRYTHIIPREDITTFFGDSESDILKALEKRSKELGFHEMGDEAPIVDVSVTSREIERRCNDFPSYRETITEYSLILKWNLMVQGV